jgi:hypothetical protein
VKRAKTKFVNATLDYLAIATRLYEHARQFPDVTAARYIALAVAAPGFHRHLRRLQSDLTVVLPKAGSRLEEVVEKIERHPAAQEILRRFLFLHVVAGRLPIVPGHAILLTNSDAADPFPKAFVVDPHTVALGAGLWGKARSRLQWVWENAFCIEADIDYSHVTWSMLDPLNGTSERVLDDPRSTDAGDVEKLHNRSAWVRRAGLSIAAAGASRTASVARSIARFSVAKTRALAIKLSLLNQSASWVALKGEWWVRAGCASLSNRFFATRQAYGPTTLRDR